MTLTNTEINLWNKAQNCNCGVAQQDKSKDHKLCGICSKTMIYGAHQSIQNQNKSKGAWNVDHIIPKSHNGTNESTNLQAVHIYCNQNKGNQLPKTN